MPKQIPRGTTPVPKTPDRKTPTKKTRRRADGSPIVPRNLELPTKRVYLVRHGQSQGQTAKTNGLDRKKDPKLLDCGITAKGESEALGVRKILGEDNYQSIELVVSSPLTRALQTSLLAFQDKNIILNFNLREIGSKVPENCPRDTETVIRDLKHFLAGRDQNLLLDISSMRPNDWPRDYTPNVTKKDRVRQALKWLYDDRDESVIAVVCHYNVIRSAVIDGEQLRPLNAIPIPCTLYSNGELVIESANGPPMLPS